MGYALIASAIAGTMLTGPLAAQPAAAQPSTSVVKAPGDLMTTTTVSANDVWSVGAYPTGGSYMTLAEHWDGRSWKRVDTPNPPNSTTSYLTAVSAVSSRDVWATGVYDQSGSGDQVPFTEHWNGRRWTIVDCPGSRGSDYGVFNGIEAVSKNDVWAVGNATVGALTTFVVHWDGHSWKQVDSPNVEGTNVNQLNHVRAVSPDNVWAVGYSGVLSVHYSTLALHWNGKTWKIVHTPNPPGSPNSDLSDVAAISATNIWASGYTYDDATSRFVTLFEHWDGHAWKRVASPSVANSDGSFILGLGAVSGGGIWAAGWYDTGGGDAPMMEHWNGHRWRLVNTPYVPGTAVSLLESATGSSASDAWAVGTYQVGGQSLALIEHWNGRTWKLVAAR